MMPATDFGNGFGTFIAQNAGAGKAGRIRSGIKEGIRITACFCAAISVGGGGLCPAAHADLY